jgi:hypothetical protein
VPVLYRLGREKLVRSAVKGVENITNKKMIDEAVVLTQIQFAIDGTIRQAVAFKNAVKVGGIIIKKLADSEDG